MRQHSAGARDRSRVPAGERGTVTAETVVVLPGLVAVALALAWLLALGATQVRVVDAAREVARAAARDDSAARAIGLGRQVAPDGAAITVRQRGGQVVAHVRSDVQAPWGLLGFLPAVHVHADAVAASEQ